MSSVTHQPYCASLLLAGPAGGEVCKVLGISVSYAPPVVERELIKVDRAPVNNVHNGELGLSAKRAGTAALQLLFREINHNQPVQRLWIEIDPPSLQVTGRSAELLFGLVAYLHLGAPSLPEGVPDCDFMATGLLDTKGNVGSVEAVTVKVRAALASGPKVGTRLFYPRADEAQIDDDLRAECRNTGLILCPVDRIDEALDALGVEILGSWPDVISPFRALEAFDTRFSRVFFGRQREVEALASLLEARAAAGRPGALVIGASGAGKSSFCLAGVLPALIKRKPGLQYAVWRPRDAASGLGDEPADEQRLAQGILSQWQVRDEKQLGMALAATPEGTPSLQDLPACLATDAGQCSVFVIDQFEELFTLNFTAQARIGFARLLQSLQARGIWVIGTLRSEFYASYLELADEEGQVVLTPLFEGDGQYNLPRMSRDAFSQVITRPAELAGLQFEQHANGVSLAQTLLADAMATDDALPLLGFALQKLYDAQERPETNDSADATFPRTLGFAAYEKLGGLAGAIGTVAAEAYSALDAKAHAELPGLLNALAVPSADGTRETARPASIEQWPLGTPGRRLLDALTGIRVLVSEQGATPDAPAFVRVAHEALFSHWDMAAKLLNDSRQSRLLIEDFRQRAKLWDDDDQPREALLTSKRDVENGRAVLPLLPVTDGNGALIAFISKSVSRARWQRGILLSSVAAAALSLLGIAAYANERAAEAEANRIIAVREAANAEKSAQSARLAEGVARESEALANTERDRAQVALRAEEAASLRARLAALSERQQRAEAMRQRDAALAATRVAMEQRQLAEAQTLEARRQRSRAVAQLAEQAIDSGDAMTGILLARSQLQSGDEANWTAAAESALLRGIHENREIKSWRGNGSAILDAMFRDQGRNIQTVSSNGEVTLFNLDNKIEKSYFMEGGAPSLAGMFLNANMSRDGKRIVAANILLTQITEIDDKERKSTIYVGSSRADTAQFSLDGKTLVITSGDGSAKIHSLESHPVWSVLRSWDTGAESFATLSPDGRRVLTASGDGKARIWSVKGDLSEPIILSGHREAVTYAAFSPDGHKLVTGSKDGLVIIWDIESDHTKIFDLLVGHTDRINFAEFSPDGQKVVTAAQDGTARIWSLGQDRNENLQIRSHDGPLRRAVFSPDGKHLLTGSAQGAAQIWAVDGLSAASTSIMQSEDGSWERFRANEMRQKNLSGSEAGRLWTINGAKAEFVEIFRHENNSDSIIYQNNNQNQLRRYQKNKKIWIANSQIKAEFTDVDSASGEARIWRIEGDRATSLLLEGHVDNFALSPNGKYAATLNQIKRTTRLWKLNMDRIENSVTFDTTNGSIFNFSFSHDSQSLATVSAKGDLRVWSLENGPKMSSLAVGKDAYFYRIYFSPDGKNIVTTSVDGRARLFSRYNSIYSGVILAGHTDRIEKFSFDPRGRRAISLSIDKTIRFWILDPVYPSSFIIARFSDATNVEFTPDGRYIILSNQGGQVARIFVPFGNEMLNWSATALTRCLTTDQVVSAGIDPSAQATNPRCG